MPGGCKWSRPASLKLCKDCKHYIPEVNFYGGTLLPSVFYHTPAMCTSPDFGMKVVDLIEGDHMIINGYCKDNRADETKCGAAGAKFDPATLDGRLAMLPQGE
jgi:hypothetical protein